MQIVRMIHCKFKQASTSQHSRVYSDDKEMNKKIQNHTLVSSKNIKVPKNKKLRFFEFLKV